MTPAILLLATLPSASIPVQDPGLFDRENLVAWCIVPFDASHRGPRERAEMLQRLGIRRLAYDWRAEHLPSFDEELDALQRHGIELTALWFPTSLDEDARFLLDRLSARGLTPQLWVTGGGAPTPSPEERSARVAEEAARIRPIAEAAAKIGSEVALYNHGGWFGEPENQVAVIEALGMPNVGLVYNLHHGHSHLDRFPELLEFMKPRLLALNLNGMDPGGEAEGRKILVIGQGEEDARLLRVIRESGWHGPVGILDHVPEADAETQLRANLDGLRRTLGPPSP
ncbi:sugar phosphate isomerase/epimerase family protein [Tautonia plasticadhaerens]|uniref:Xylose isomerase-like TIM barrel n=1 Tax=Tautonia plasticadhaerens TaxID=2527974 RepID=A0A518GXE1_9BACT|nr:TIM barrel protein [Tautonia plasticadhaerens]QDV33257.1 Xylose isomerase-like TIM barrel [Tautonia plasticadhaerens]